MSPYIASCMLVDQRQREPSELHTLSKHLSDIETDKYVRRNPARPSFVKRLISAFGRMFVPRWGET